MCTLLLLVACEDGPKRIFSPNAGDLSVQNGYDTPVPFRQQGSTGWDDSAGGGDSHGRARFCDQPEIDALVQQMVQEPLLPDRSGGGIPLWTSESTPMSADDLLGSRKDGKFCDPTYTYSNAFVWGPNFEIIVFFDSETRLITDIQVGLDYLGDISGERTIDDTGGEQESVIIDLSRELNIGGRRLIDYAGSAEQANKPNSWLNHKNITAVYAMLRETFFGAEPLAKNYDCVTSKVCDVIYAGQDESVPQQTNLVFKDVGVTLVVAPNGVVTYVVLSPIRTAPFEVSAEISFAPDRTPLSFAPRFRSAFADCDLTITDGITWSNFKESCIGPTADQLLGRFNYDVHTQRNGVDVQFNGVSLSFLRVDPNAPKVMNDGERPADEDVLYGINFTRTLDASVVEFTASELAIVYKEKLQKALARAVYGSVEEHPFGHFDLHIPAYLSNQPQRIGELYVETSAGSQESWIAQVIEDVQALYEQLSPDERALVDPDVVQPLYVVEPFVDAVLASISHDASEEPSSHKLFRTTDNRKWSIGFANFMQDGQPYRIVVQYSLFFGAVTSVTVEAGFSAIDQVINQQNDFLRMAMGQSEPYYTADLVDIGSDVNPIGLGGRGIGVDRINADRSLQMMPIFVTINADWDSEANDFVRKTYALDVSGRTWDDRGGYTRQLRGERFEFIPADEIMFYGEDTYMVLYVRREDGAIGRVDMTTFKGGISLCDGLIIDYGDDVRKKVDAWARERPLTSFESCEIVYNYSENGNVLDAVVSLSRRIAIGTSGDRAISVSMWL